MTGVLHRMVRRQQADAPDVPLTATRAVKLAVTRAAQSSVGLVVDVTGVADRTCDLDGLLIFDQTMAFTNCPEGIPYTGRSRFSGLECAG